MRASSSNRSTNSHDALLQGVRNVATAHLGLVAAPDDGVEGRRGAGQVHAGHGRVLAQELADVAAAVDNLDESSINQRLKCPSAKPCCPMLSDITVMCSF